MKKTIAVLVIMAALMQFAAAKNDTLLTYNGSSAGSLGNNTTLVYGGPNTTNTSWLPNVNLSNVGNITKTGVGPLDDAVKFLADASPFLLLIIGIIILLLAGFAKIIGIILIVLALIRIVWMLMGWG